MHKMQVSRYIASDRFYLPLPREFRPMEIWLRTNPRPFWAALVLPLVLAIAGVVGLGFAIAGGAIWLYGLGGGILLLLALLLTGMFLWRANAPVLAIQRDNLLLYLGSTSPIAIPVQIVECFFTGQTDALLKDRAGKELEASTVILRIAESAKDWHHRDVDANLAHWCEGYITLRGTWCEPIGPELMRSLNQRLVQAQRNLKVSQS